METTVDTPKRYKGRRDGCVIVTLQITLDPDTAQVLRAFGQPGRRGQSQLVARLLHEHVARQEERRLLVQRLLEERETLGQGA